MTFYQELQLSSAGSKQLIHKTTTPKEKRCHILIYNFKVYLVMAFCVAVVSLFSKFLEPENSVVGVTVLLAILVLRQADFGIRKYASATSRISCASCLHPVTNDFWMPQCYYV